MVNMVDLMIDYNHQGSIFWIIPKTWFAWSINVGNRQLIGTPVLFLIMKPDYKDVHGFAHRNSINRIK